MVDILNKIVKNGELNSKNFNLALNTKLQRLSYTFFSLQLETLGAYLIVFLINKSKIGLIESEIVRRYQKWSQS